MLTTVEKTSVVTVSIKATDVFASNPWLYNAIPESNSMTGLFALSSSRRLAVNPFAVAVVSKTDLWNHLLYLDQAFWSKESLLIVI